MGFTYRPLGGHLATTGPPSLRDISYVAGAADLVPTFKNCSYPVN